MHVSVVEEYLDGVLDKLSETGGVSERDPVILIESESESIAVLDGEIQFSDGSRLAFLLTVSGYSGYPDWSEYSFHYMDARGRCIFRYDNAPHRPGLPHFPNHKHIGPDQTPLGHPKPSVAQVVSEVQDILALR